MAKLYESPVCLAVINPKGRDPFLDYKDGIDSYDPSIHAPVNFHAYAGATFGAFCDDVSQIIDQKDRFDAVVVLIRRRAWLSLEAAKKLKEAGFIVMAGWKECGHTQITNQLKSVKALRAYQELLLVADGILSPTLAWPPRCGEISYDDFWAKARFVATPYPVEYPDWNFSCPLSKKSGIMIGTREFVTLARNHVHAIARAASLAHELNLPRVTVVNSERAHGMKKLLELSKAFPENCLQIYEKPLTYLEYMDLLASHRIILQMDRSGVPGQVAGDSLLARTLCAGGSSSLEEIAFKSLSDDGTLRLESVFERIKLLMTDDEAYEDEIRSSQDIALKKLSFQAIAHEFADWIEVLKQRQS